MEKTKGYKCQDCDAIINPEDQDVDIPLYECGACSTKFNRDNSYDGGSHQCPECLKFASKVSDKCCPECEEGELDEIDIIENTEGEWVEYEEGMEDQEEEDA